MSVQFNNEKTYPLIYKLHYFYSKFCIQYNLK